MSLNYRIVHFLTRLPCWGEVGGKGGGEELAGASERVRGDSGGGGGEGGADHILRCPVLIVEISEQ